MTWPVNVYACLYVHVGHCIALVCTFGTCRDHCAGTLMQDDTCHELVSSLLCEGCKRSRVVQQRCARPLTGRGGRQSFSERLVPMLLQEMMMSEVEASSELDLVGGHQQYRNCTEPAKRHSLLR